MEAKRNDLIRDILDAFDTIDELRYDNRMLRERLASYEVTDPVPAESVGYIEVELIKMARKDVLKKGIGYWHSVRVEVDDDSGEVKGIQPFDSWVRESTNGRDLPSWLSLDAFRSYFEDDLREQYEKERETALAAIHNEGC